MRAWLQTGYNALPLNNMTTYLTWNSENVKRSPVAHRAYIVRPRAYNALSLSLRQLPILAGRNYHLCRQRVQAPKALIPNLHDAIRSIFRYHLELCASSLQSCISDIFTTLSTASSIVQVSCRMLLTACYPMYSYWVSSASQQDFPMISSFSTSILGLEGDRTRRRQNTYLIFERFP